MLLMIALICIAYGLYAVIRGKLPLMKNYHNVKNIPLHSRIEGGAVLLTGILILLQPILQIGKVPLVILILGLAILAIILEILLKVI